MNKKIRILLSHVYVDRIKSVPVATKGSLPFRWKILHTFFTTPRKLSIQSYHSQTKSVSTSRINPLPSSIPLPDITAYPGIIPQNRRERKKKFSDSSSGITYRSFLLPVSLNRFCQLFFRLSLSTVFSLSSPLPHPSWINTRSILNRVTGCTA